MSTAADLWASFPHDPRDPANASLRASDADRNVVAQALTDAFADGRLDREEYDERSSSALAARTLGQLPPLVNDLVPERPLATPYGSSSSRTPLALAGPDELDRRAVEKFEDERRNAFLAFTGPTLICWVIWFLTSFGDGGFHPYWPWPLFVTVPTMVNAIRVLASRKEIIRRERDSLERRQAKALRARDSKPNPES